MLKTEDIMAKNISFTYFDSTHKTAREGEVPTADFDGGCNLGCSVGNCVGVSTGIFDFNEQNFSLGDAAYVQAQYIGQNKGSAVAIRDFVVGGSSQFIPSTAADTDPGDGFITGLLNLTGKMVPAGSRVFGFRA
jgi:hypothetical protein